ncbi:hypothetical protein D082_31960 [Synechocystis sp. PCC 6714]|nr:hypothetical protein D082_31960 [Synechocystis sp. PCC 6714]
MPANIGAVCQSCNFWQSFLNVAFRKIPEPRPIGRFNVGDRILIQGLA